MSYRERLPIPEGMTKEVIDSMKVTDGEWRESPSFVCRTCQNSAFYHPYCNEIWGCKKCGFTTYSVADYFRPLRPSEISERARK